MPKIKCPYTYPHKSRTAMVDYLCGVGGYSSRDGRWPIEFNVGAYYADFDFDRIWEKYSGEHIPNECKKDPAALSAYYSLAKTLHASHKDMMWGWGVEDACRSITEDDTFKTLWDGTPVDAELQLQGRGGKHLVINKFNGFDLDHCNEDALNEGLSKGSEGWGWSYDDVRLFYRYVRQCEVDFTPQKASDEVEFQGAFCFFANIVAPAWDIRKVEMSDHSAAVDAARVLFGIEMSSGQLDAFRTLCDAANVTEDEAEGRC